VAAVNKPAREIYEFGPFRLDATERLLWRDGQVVPLPPRIFDTLLALVVDGGHLLEKDDLMRRLWPDTFVEEATLARNISDLRKALRETEGGQKYIETVPKRGYRFVARIRKSGDSAVDREKRLGTLMIVEAEDGAIQLSQPARSGLGRSDNRANAARRSRAWLVAGLALVAGTAAIVYVWNAKSKETGTAAPAGSIAVLPLKNLTNDPAQDYFSDGMTESLITALSKIEGLRVISRGSVFRFKGKDDDPRDIGKQLGVAAVLEGSVRKSNDSVRVAVRLVSVKDGQVLWVSDTHERALGDIFALQDEVARRVVGGLRLKLGREGEQRLAKRHTDNVEAYQSYLKGRFFWNKRNGEGLGKAISYFQQAIDIDPNYGLAYAGLADSYILKRIYSLLQPGETLQQMEAKAKAAAEKALEIDDTLAEAHTSLGLIKATTANDEADIEREYKQAIELNPNYATAHHWYALHLNDEGRFEEAIAEIRRALEIDPLSLVINSDEGIVFSSARQYDQAIEYFKKAMEMDPNFPDTHAMLGWTYVRKGMYQEAISEFEKARALFGSPTSQLDGLIYAYGRSGNRSEALKVRDKLERLTKQHNAQIPWENWVYIHIGLGDHDKAFAILEKAYREGLSVKRLLDAPYLDPLRSDPRFQDLVRRVGV
jgi:TolB-like protein/DNA-binding winged helix-turn-helix (wHTH) protein/tetratricopeptide (TPR) repeat protein